MQLKYTLITMALIIGFLIPVSSYAKDIEHFGASLFLGAASESYFHYQTKLGGIERILYGTIVGSVPGFIKEVYDSGEDRNHFSGRQMAADVAGAFVGAVIANFINNKVQIKIEKNKKKTTISLSYKF